MPVSVSKEIDMTDEIPPKPSMDAEGLQYFKESVDRSQCYLEFGSGGSTVYAANIAKTPVIISVESDKLWLDKVKASVISRKSGLHIEYCDIGEVGNWGIPTSNEKIEHYWKYVAAPWQVAARHNLVPDTILIDGRFRVASFLSSLVNARVGATILFDDYMDRPKYFIAEKFCQMQEIRGRMAVFTAAKTFSLPAICEKIAQYSTVWA